MTEPAHTRLSPSASARWLSCPASIRLEAELEPGEEAPESRYAAEGTAAHAFGELVARDRFLRLEAEEFAERMRAVEEMPYFDSDEMNPHIAAYVELIGERLARHPNSVLLLEQRFATGVPECKGTSDAVIVSPEHIEIIDLKYGMGVAVESEGNSQLRLYGVGALEAFDGMLGNLETVYMTVFQPRIRNVSTATMSAEALREWRDEVVIPLAKEALGPNAHFGPSESACRWCPLSGRCRVQMEHFTSIDFGRDIDLLSPEEMAEALAVIPGIRRWADSLEEASLRVAYSEGKTIPGYKVVLSGGRRVITDSDKAIEALVQVGYRMTQVSSRKVLGIGTLEKLLGDDFGILDGYITKTEGRPSLVPESDRRPEISPASGAAKDFAEETEGTEE